MHILPSLYNLTFERPLLLFTLSDNIFCSFVTLHLTNRINLWDQTVRRMYGNAGGLFSTDIAVSKVASGAITALILPRHGLR